MLTSSSRVFFILFAAFLTVIPATGWEYGFLEQQVTAPDGAANDWFGNAVALDGDFALIGAYTDDIGANGEQGSAYVFTRDETGWSLQQKLTASDGEAGDRFGTSVALYGDTALVGAYTDTVGGNEWQGSAYVFTRSGTTWSEQAKLIAPDGAWRDNFGIAVALSDDTALVGASLDDVDANGDQGSAYVFIRSGTNWSLQQKLNAADGAVSDHFGNSVALAGDTLLVGANQGDVGTNAEQGSAYVFTRSGTSWSLQQKLTAADGAAGDYFGNSVALSGETALMGAGADDIDANDNQGSAYVFTRSGTHWTLQQKLTAPDGMELDIFGNSVALSDDTALVGTHWDAIDTNNHQGSAYLFTRCGTAWNLQQKLIAADGAAGDEFGISTAISSDTALVGAYWDDVGTNANQGSVYFYDQLPVIYLPLITRDTT
jgi:hypothetical protein